ELAVQQDLLQPEQLVGTRPGSRRRAYRRPQENLKCDGILRARAQVSAETAVTEGRWSARRKPESRPQLCLWPAYACSSRTIARRTAVFSNGASSVPEPASSSSTTARRSSARLPCPLDATRRSSTRRRPISC